MSYSEKENNTATNVIKNLFPNAAENEIKQKAKELLDVAYAIGANYLKDTLIEIAKTYYKIDD